MAQSAAGLIQIASHVARHLLEAAGPSHGSEEAVGEALATGEGDLDRGIVSTLIAWQVAILFLGFVLITVVWHFLIALLRFVTVNYTGRKALWVTRLQEEVLLLGVITLTLVVIEASLANICIDGVENTYSHEEFPDHHCPEGQHLLFTRWRILQTHLLLFAAAVTFILYACTSLYVCIFRLRFWRKWELQAKIGAATDIDAPHIFRRLTTSSLAHGLRMAVWNSWHSHIRQETYTMLRLVFRLRMDAADLANPLPRQANFLNIVEQGMEVNYAEASQYSWVLSVAMAIFLCIPIQLHALYWLFGISAAVTLLCAAKLQSVVVHLSAMAYFDFHAEINDHSFKMAQFDSQHCENLRALNDTAHGQVSTPPALQPSCSTEPMLRPPMDRGRLARTSSCQEVDLPSPCISVFNVELPLPPAPATYGIVDSLPATSDALREPASGSQHVVVHIPSSNGPDAVAAAPASCLPPVKTTVQVVCAMTQPATAAANSRNSHSLAAAAAVAVPTVGSSGGSRDASLHSSQDPSLPSTRGSSLRSTRDAGLRSSRGASLRSNRDSSWRSNRDPGLRINGDPSWRSNQDGSLRSTPGSSARRSRESPPRNSAPQSGGCAPPNGGSTKHLDAGGDASLWISVSPSGLGTSLNRVGESPSGSPRTPKTPGTPTSYRAGQVGRSGRSVTGVGSSGRSVTDRLGMPEASMDFSRRRKALLAAGITSETLQRRVERPPLPAPWWRRGVFGCCSSQQRDQQQQQQQQQHGDGSTSMAADPIARPHWQVETEFDSYRHRVRGHLKDSDGRVSRNASSLFWFGSPTLLLWLFQICYMENSLSLTILLYGLIRDTSGIKEEAGLGGIIALIVLDVALLLFASTAVLPVYALVSTVATSRPEALIEEIRMQKLVFDKEEYERGTGGWLLRLLRITKAEDKDGRQHQKREVDTEFMLLLADQAGVVTAFGQHVAYPLKHESIYRELSYLWLEHAAHWHAHGRRSEAHLVVRGDMSRFRETFEWLQLDASCAEEGSGYGITAKELAAEMRRLGTRCNKGELDDMIAEVDYDGSGEVGFQEYVLFMCFKFFDHDNDGMLDIHDIAAAMAVLEMEERDVHEYSTMIHMIDSHGQADDGRPGGRVELDEFLRFFFDVDFEHEETPLDPSHVSLKCVMATEASIAS